MSETTSNLIRALSTYYLFVYQLSTAASGCLKCLSRAHASPKHSRSQGSLFPLPSPVAPPPFHSIDCIDVAFSIIQRGGARLWQLLRAPPSNHAPPVRSRVTAFLPIPQPRTAAPTQLQVLANVTDGIGEITLNRCEMRAAVCWLLQQRVWRHVQC